MRFLLGMATAVILGAAALFLGWQQSEIRHLRAQVAEQGAALPHPRINVRPVAFSNSDPATLSADERRFVADQYREVLAKLDLPPTKASRLQNLLTERIEAALDAQEAAAREGFAPGSAETAQAESSAIAVVDQEIAALLGNEDDRRLVMLTAGPTLQPAVVAAPTPAPVVINVITSPPPAPVYTEENDQPAYDAYSSPGPGYYSAPDYYYPPGYYSYPYATVFVGRTFGRTFGGERAGERFGGVRPPSASFGHGGERVVRRTR